MDVRFLLQNTYHAALQAVNPAQLMQPHLQGPPPDFILAFGKAALPMARAALEAYPGTPALVIPPRGTADLSAPPSAQVMPGSHPVPDEFSVQAAEEALKCLGELRAGQEALLLVSGGGSALLCAPDGVTLAQKQALTQALLRAGADIGEINTVRKHLSRVKGGRLAQATQASLRALLISDVIGDDMSIIASGPSLPDPTTYADALAVLNKYRIDAPEARAHFQTSTSDTPKILPNVQNTVIGSNRILLEAAQQHLQAQGLPAVILGDTFAGEARELARHHAAMIRSIRQHGTPFQPPVVLISGGETTVAVRGNGKGGRNSEFALWLLEFLREDGVYALSAGSDGIDGNSDAAGAFLTPDSWAQAQATGLNIEDFLARNDSASFFAALGDQLITGPSGHNLNDIRLIALF